MHEHKTLSWVRGADRKIHLRVTVWHQKAVPMPNSDPEGWIFLSAPINHDRFVFFHTLWSPAFALIGAITFLYVDVRHIENLCHMWCCNDVKSQRLNNRVMWPPIQPMYWQDVLLFVFIYPMGRIRVCKIRFVSTGENSTNPCLVCKKYS